jgi:hypothetical protein
VMTTPQKVEFTRPGAHSAKNARQVGAPNTQQSGENPMVGSTKSIVAPTHGDDFENWTTEQLRDELDTTQRILQNKRRYELNDTMIAKFSGRRVQLEQLLMERVSTETPRRGRAVWGTTFDMGREPGHPWPLEFAPRWRTDHHPWRVTTQHAIRYASYEVLEECVGGAERCGRHA